MNDVGAVAGVDEEGAQVLGLGPGPERRALAHHRGEAIGANTADIPQPHLRMILVGHDKLVLSRSNPIALHMAHLQQTKAWNAAM